MAASKNMSAFASDLGDIMAKLQGILLQVPNVDFVEVPEDLQTAKTFLTQLVDKYTDFLTYQRKNPDIKIQNVSFSKLRWNHLQDINFTHTVHRQIDFLTRIDHLAGRIYPFEHHTLLDVFDDFWRTDKSYIIDALSRDSRTFGLAGETGSRVITDLILREVCFILKTRLSRNPYIILELVLASKNPGPVFIPNQEMTMALALTGRVDYTLLTTSDSDQGMAPSSGDLLKRSHLDKVLGLPIVSKAANEGHLTVYPLEVKNPFLNPGDFLAQVNGEAMVLAKKMGKPRMPWCVTNGVDWLFGMWRETAKGYESLHLDEPIVLGNRLYGGEEGEAISSLKNILKILSVWAADDKHLDLLFPILEIQPEGEDKHVVL